ncbi:glutathione S-transferase family protein [Polyangium jinanense]|uniref:Glutathione S-transferase family protein n=1 Tax=Polyangium jinanense TaxID=2829994 RepID=A0A9X3XAA0_9BACT|nr:glutathione S-transferase family protein [Polyangium jinanense]MDC3956499.1 glutathione S-transferase family protein [Polyangium jinanense]MDC3985530.1 glutathione S-transferase family protein [Polyangium jinanense]
MYTLYIANKNYSSWSLRPWILLLEAGIPFEERLLRFGDEAAWAPFRAMTPAGKVPTLLDGERVVWDSLAIAEYLAERHPSVWPRDEAARAWARSAAAEMHAGFGVLREKCSMNIGIRVRLHETPPALSRDVARISALWTEGLERFGGPFLAGDTFTAVDAFFAPVVFRWQTYGLHFGEAAAAYATRMLERPSMRRWYDEGIAETFRDLSHDEECRAAGVWTADFRAS